jgi:Ca2+-transporting ATPase
VIGTYVGIATIGIFAYWYLYFHHTDGHTLISWNQLTHWTECHKWENFKVANFSGIVLNNPCEYFTHGKRKAVTLSLTVLVVIEMFNAMNAISDESSLIRMPPWKNIYLILAIIFSMTLHLMILYVPFFNNVFAIMPLDGKEWLLVLVFSFPVIILDEFVKLYTRLAGGDRNSRKEKIE